MDGGPMTPRGKRLAVPVSADVTVAAAKPHTSWPDVPEDMDEMCPHLKPGDCPSAAMRLLAGCSVVVMVVLP